MSLKQINTRQAEAITIKDNTLLEDVKLLTFFGSIINKTEGADEDFKTRITKT